MGAIVGVVAGVASFAVAQVLPATDFIQSGSTITAQPMRDMFLAIDGALADLGSRLSLFENSLVVENGRVGLGTGDPLAQLHIRSAPATTGMPGSTALLLGNGYLQLDTYLGTQNEDEPPPSLDCSSADHIGRISVNRRTGALFSCLQDAHAGYSWSELAPVTAHMKIMAAAAAVAMCRIGEDNATTDAVRMNQGESGNEACNPCPHASSCNGCREVHSIYLYGDRGEVAEGDSKADCNVFRADYTSNAALYGSFACCIR